MAVAASAPGLPTKAAFKSPQRASIWPDMPPRSCRRFCRRVTFILASLLSFSSRMWSSPLPPIVGRCAAARAARKTLHRPAACAARVVESVAAPRVAATFTQDLGPRAILSRLKILTCLLSRLAPSLLHRDRRSSGAVPPPAPHVRRYLGPPRVVAAHAGKGATIKIQESAGFRRHLGAVFRTGAYHWPCFRWEAFGRRRLFGRPVFPHWHLRDRR